MKDKYEISMWQDVWDPNVSRYVEKKIAVIGADWMTASIRAIDPKLVQNTNGTNKFSFKMYYVSDKGEHFQDVLRQFNFLGTSNDQVLADINNFYLTLMQVARDTKDDPYYRNPFIPFLFNERKIKVKWRDEWYDFIIKNIKEDSNNKTVTYECEDQYISELAKNGFNIIFDTELENNQGTAPDLAVQALDTVDWYVVNDEGKLGTLTSTGVTYNIDSGLDSKYYSDIIYQKEWENFYSYKVVNKFEAVQLDNNGTFTSTTIQSGWTIGIPYSIINLIKNTTDIYTFEKNEFQFCTNGTLGTWGYDQSGKAIDVNCYAAKGFVYGIKMKNSFFQENNNATQTYYYDGYGFVFEENGDPLPEEILQILRQGNATAVSEAVIDGNTSIDLNHDGEVNAGDAIYLLYRTLFGEDRYPINAWSPVIMGKRDTLTTTSSPESADAIRFLYHTLFGNERYEIPNPENCFKIGTLTGTSMTFDSGWPTEEIDEITIIDEDDFKSGWIRNTQNSYNVFKFIDNNFSGITKIARCYTNKSQKSEECFFAHCYNTQYYKIPFKNGDEYKATFNTATYILAEGASNEYNSFAINPNKDIHIEQIPKLINTQKMTLDPITDKYVEIYTATSSMPGYDIGDKIYGWTQTEFKSPQSIVNLISNPNSFISGNGWHVTQSANNATMPTAITRPDFASYTVESALDIKYFDSFLDCTVSSDQYLFNDCIRASRTYLQDGLQNEQQYILELKARNPDDWEEYIWGSSTDPTTIFDVSIQEYNPLTYQPIEESYVTVEPVPTDLKSDNTLTFLLKVSKSCSLDALLNKNIGLFLKAKDNLNFYLEETRLYSLYYGYKTIDDKQKFVQFKPGDIDTSIVALKHYKYYNHTKAVANNITDINDVELLYDGNKYITAEEGGLQPSTITGNWQEIGVTVERDFNDRYEKFTQISIKESNRFNILQTIAEQFQCWVRFYVKHNEDGSIAYIETGDDLRAEKYVYFKREFGQEINYGFKYGEDLKSISRDIKSNEVVTKTIVKDSANEFGKNGFCSIARSQENLPRSNFILNFDYFLDKGLLDKELFIKDLYYLQGITKEENPTLENTPYLGYFQKLNQLNTEYDKRAMEYQTLVADYNELYPRVKINKEKLYSTRNQIDALISDLCLRANINPQSVNNPLMAILEYFKGRVDNTVMGKIKEVVNLQTEILEYLEEEPMEDPVGSFYTFTTETYPTWSDASYQGVYKLENRNGGSNTWTFSGTTTTDYGFPIRFRGTVPSAKVTFFSEKTIKLTNSTTNSLKTFYYTQSSDDDPQGRGYLEYWTARSDDDAVPEAYGDIGYVLCYTPQNDFKNYSVAMIPSDISNPKGLKKLGKLEAQIKEKKEELQELIQKIEEQDKLFQKRYLHYIYEGTWNDDSYTDDNLYFYDAQQVAYTSSRPQVSYNISVMRITGTETLARCIVEEGNPVWKTVTPYLGKDFKLGNISWVEDTEFFGYANGKPYREKVLITEITYNFESPEKDSFKVQNYRTQFEDLFQRITASTQSLKLSEGEYKRTASRFSSDGTINARSLSASFEGNNTLSITTQNESIIWDGSGITVTNQNSPNKKVRINSSGMLISEDGGQNWNWAVKGTGIDMNQLTDGKINIGKVIIVDEEHPEVKWDEKGLAVNEAWFGNYFNTETPNTLILGWHIKEGRMVGGQEANGTGLGLQARQIEGTTAAFAAGISKGTSGVWGNAPFAVTHTGHLRSTDSSMSNCWIWTGSSYEDLTSIINELRNR